jgi:hypothetical protein
VAHTVESLPSKCEALSSNSSTDKKYNFMTKVLLNAYLYSLTVNSMRVGTDVLFLK